MKSKTTKRLIGILAAALVLSVGAVSAFAAGPSKKVPVSQNSSGQNYTDDNGDGICDNSTNCVSPQTSGGHHNGNHGGHGHFGGHRNR